MFKTFEIKALNIDSKFKIRNSKFNLSMHKQQIIESLTQQLKQYQSSVTVEKVGTVFEVGDGIAKISGLADAMAGEMLAFGNNVFRVALNLEEDFIGAIILGDYKAVAEGSLVKST